MLHALGHFCVRYRWLVIILWIAAIIAGSIVIGRVGAITNNNLSLPGTGSQAATDLLTINSLNDNLCLRGCFRLDTLGHLVNHGMRKSK